MTFEEFNRAMEFIVEQQAEFSARLGRDHEWARSVIGQMAVSNQHIVELLASNSRRLDQNDQEHRKFEETQKRHAESQEEAHRRHEKFQEESQRRHEEFQRESQKRHEEMLAELNRILQRLTGNNQKPN